ncbi:MAG: hypothetical protein H7834_16135, partial [Magnetococcus sp. YQC-9]
EGLEPTKSYTLKVFSATKVKSGDWSTTGTGAGGYAASCPVVAASGDGGLMDLTLGTVCP